MFMLKDTYVFYEANIDERDKRPGWLEMTQDSLEQLLEDFGSELPFNRYSNGQFKIPFVFISDDLKRQKSTGKLSTQALSDAIEELVDSCDEKKIGNIVWDLVQLILAKLDDIMLDEKAHMAEPADRFVVHDKLYDVIKRYGMEANEEEQKLLLGIQRLIENWKLAGGYVLGEYLKDRNQIILYRRAIMREVDTYDLHQDMENTYVLAHELFHAYHYQISKRNGLWGSRKDLDMTDFEKDILKEALADYFAIHWCFEQKIREFIEVGTHRVEEWAANYYSCWPYAKALNFVIKAGFSHDNNWALPVHAEEKEIEAGVDCFMHVFEQSLKEPIKAYNELMSVL